MLSKDAVYVMNQLIFSLFWLFKWFFKIFIVDSITIFDISNITCLCDWNVIKYHDFGIVSIITPEV